MTSPDGEQAPGVRIAFVQSTWHESIVDRCRDSFIEEIVRLGVAKDRIDLFRVPGAFEIPLHAKRLASSGKYAAVVGAGLVIDGGIYRHDFVAEAVITGLMRVQLDTDVPIISAVLTPHHFHEHDEHALFFAEHFRVKGAEAARACATTVQSLARLPQEAIA
jgi:6,7-dimethyl-8-ribityllumazine synthase